MKIRQKMREDVWMRVFMSALIRKQVTDFSRIGQTAVAAKCPEMQQSA
jgi:hypothetical protein